VFKVLLILAGHILKHFRVDDSTRFDRHRPRAVKGTGIVERDLQVHVPGVNAMESLNDVQSFGVRRSSLAKPREIVESNTLHDQSVSFPAAYRITHEARVRIFFQLPPINENAAKREIGIEQRDESRSLNNLRPTARRQSAKESARTSRETFERRWIVPAPVFDVLSDDRLRPRLQVVRTAGAQDLDRW
jgi:hypothetical protein